MSGSFASRLRRWLGFGDTAGMEREADAPALPREEEASVRAPNPSETAHLAPGGVDEVKVDLGPDEGGPGLLERWSDATSSGEPTSAPPANAPLPELPEVTIKASRSAIPFDRTLPRVDLEPAPTREVTVTEVVSPTRVPWAFFAAIAIVLLTLLYALSR